MASVEPQNDRNHVTFTPLPKSETDANREDDEGALSSVFVESTTTRPSGIPDYYYVSSSSSEDDDDTFNVSERTCEMIQDLIGLTMLMALVFLPLFRRLGSPKEDPIPPIFILNSMYITNFTVGGGGGGLAATWDAKFTVINTNVSSIYFQSVDFTIFYKKNPENVLSAVSSYPFYLDKGDFVKLHLKFITKEKGMWEDDQVFVENELVEEIGKDRSKDGSLNFGMQMNVQAIYYGQTWVSDVLMTPHCEDLKVQFFPNNKDSGRLVNPDRNFSVPIQWKPFTFF